jgi:hypothetical protein
MNIERSSIPIVKLQQEILKELTPQVVKYINTNTDSDNISDRNISFSKEEIADKIEKILRKNPKMTVQEAINKIISERGNVLYGLKNMAA